MRFFSSGSSSVEFEQTARDAVDELKIDRATSWSALVSILESHYGKPIRFVPVDDKDWNAVTGLFLDTPREGLIYFRAEHSFLFQLHNIFHEFGHILLRSKACQLSEGVTQEDAFTLGIRDEFQRAYANGFVFTDPALVANEREAEAIAYLIARRLRARPTTIQTEVFG